MKPWRADPEWLGETVYIIAGGPSVANHNLELLRDRKVIVINSSYKAAPWADILFFADRRWWDANNTAKKVFEGKIVTTAKNMPPTPQFFYMEKIAPPPGLTTERNKLAMQRTSLQGAINLAVHLGAIKIVILGADMCKSEDGRTHHHEPHRWAQKPGCWEIQMAQLSLCVSPLKKLGIEMVNCSPVSLIDWWPKLPFEDTLC